MSFFVYKIKCGSFPSRMTMHSIVRHMFDNKQDPKFTVEKIGRVVIVKTNIDIEDTFSIELKNEKGVKFHCSLMNKSTESSLSYNLGDKVYISGHISYAVNLTKEGLARCPVYLGRFEKDAEGKTLRVAFKANLERSLGVKAIYFSNDYFNRTPNERLNNKIQLNNQISIINLPVIVEDPETFNSIAYSAKFQKKSYGFGKIEINPFNGNDFEEAL